MKVISLFISSLFLFALSWGCSGSSSPGGGAESGDGSTLTAPAQTAEMDGPGMFARPVTKNDFPTGPSVDDLIWMDQVNGTITKEEALRQYFCSILKFDPPCLNQKYLDEADPITEATNFEVSANILQNIDRAIKDPNISAEGKDFIRKFMGHEENAGSKSLTAKSTPFNWLPNLVGMHGSNRDVKEHGACATAVTVSRKKKIRICYPGQSQSAAQVAILIRDTLQSTEDPWETFARFFGNDAVSLYDDGDYWIFVSDVYKDGIFGLVRCSSGLSEYDREFYGWDKLALGASELTMSTSMLGKKVYEDLRGTIDLDSKEIVESTLTHELFHAFACEFKRSRNSTSLLTEDAMADDGADMVFPRNKTIHSRSFAYRKSSANGFESFVSPKNDRSYPLYLWQYYLAKRYGDYEHLRRFLDAVSAPPPVDPWNVLETQAMENDNFLGFAASMLNLNARFSDSGVIRFSDIDKNEKGEPAYPPFLLMNFTGRGAKDKGNDGRLGLLPGSFPSDKIYHSFKPLSPLGVDYLPMATNLNGIDKGGAYSCYKVEPELDPPEALLGVFAINTDPYNRKEYRVIDFRKISSTQPTELCYDDPDDRPDILVFVMANPSLKQGTRGGFTVSALPFHGLVSFSGGFEENDLTVTFSSAKMEYVPAGGNTTEFRWMPVQTGQRQLYEKTIDIGNRDFTGNLGNIYCPAVDKQGNRKDGWMIMEGTVELSMDQTVRWEAACSVPGPNGTQEFRGAKQIIEESYIGSESFSIKKKCGVGLGLSVEDGTWSGSVSCKIAGDEFKVKHKVNHKDSACGSAPFEEDVPMGWSDSVRVQGTYKTGADTLNNSSGQRGEGRYEELTFSLPNPALEQADIDKNLVQMIIYTGGEKPQEPNPQYRSQFVPWIMDDLGAIAQPFPTCVGK